MREIVGGLHVGTDRDCFRDQRDGWAVVHACKHPCHVEAVGYRGSLPSDHPNYLLLEDDGHLYMNLIDPERPLFRTDSFRGFRDFATRHREDGSELLIHCNQGRSRAPSLALLFLAKDLERLTSDSFDAARREYLGLDPDYLPGSGIQTFLQDNWSEL